MRLRFNEVSEGRGELVIETDKLIPDLCACSEFLLYGFKAASLKSTCLKRFLDSLGRVFRAIEGNADAR